MKVVLVGGGSGGHLTPLLAVARSLKDKDSTIETIHIGQKGEDLQSRLEHDTIDDQYQITAGKFRRYHGESFWQHVRDIKTQVYNVRDLFRFIRGIGQAWRLLGKLQPDVIFLKGGFVSVPVGYAARLRRIPYITHDSDAIPGLANRLTAKHAAWNTTAMPADLYPYDQQKTRQVGVPLEPEFKKVTARDIAAAKNELGYKKDDVILLSIGGGLGAQNLNESLVSAAPTLLDANKSLHIMHVTGKKLFDETQDSYEQTLPKEQLSRVQCIDFSNQVHMLSAASDVVLTRGGATNVAEFATQAKPCVIVPAPHLTGGQQLHNARVIEQRNAAVVLYEQDLERLPEQLQQMFDLPDKERQAYGDRLHELSVDGAADSLAALLIEAASGK